MGLGFAAACDIQPGDKIIRGSTPREVLGTCHRGKNWPYYRIAYYPEVLESYDEGLPTLPEGSVWVSWQTCG